MYKAFQLPSTFELCSKNWVTQVVTIVMLTHQHVNFKHNSGDMEAGKGERIVYQMVLQLKPSVGPGWQTLPSALHRLGRLLLNTKCRLVNPLNTPWTSLCVKTGSPRGWPGGRPGLSPLAGPSVTSCLVCTELTLFWGCLCWYSVWGKTFLRLHDYIQ